MAALTPDIPLAMIVCSLLLTIMHCLLLAVLLSAFGGVIRLDDQLPTWKALTLFLGKWRVDASVPLWSMEMTHSLRTPSGHPELG